MLAGSLKGIVLCLRWPSLQPNADMRGMAAWVPPLSPCQRAQATTDPTRRILQGARKGPDRDPGIAWVPARRLDESAGGSVERLSLDEVR
jgi:hypothetical protein